MDIMEAYRRTLDAANELRAKDVEVEIVPSKADTRAPDDPLPRDKWVNIIFTLTNPEQAKEINQKATELGWSGISFDMSGTVGEREWEIDWSFKAGDVPDGEWEARRDDLEDKLGKMEDQSGCESHE